MEKILNESISWNLLEDYRDRCHFHIDEVVYHKTDKILNLYISLNFIIPYQDIIRIKKKLADQFSFILDVCMVCEYQDVILSKNEILHHYRDYLWDSLSKDKQHLLKALKEEDYEKH